MTRLNVYLPDDLAAQAKDAGLNLSAVTQEAVRQTLAARSTDSWLSSALQPVSTGAVTRFKITGSMQPTEGGQHFGVDVSGSVEACSG